MKKEKIKNIVLIIVVAVISSTITSFATSNYLYDSVDVKYDNSNGVQAETVQGAIDELYSCASDYSTLNNKINGYFQNNPTSYFDGNVLELGKTNTTSNTNLYFYNKNILSGAIYGRHSDNALVITTQSGQTLDIAGDPVKINGVDVSNISTVTGTYKGLTITLRKLGKVVDCYVSGTISGTITTIDSNGAGTYETIYTIPSGYRPVYSNINFVFISSLFNGQLNPYASGELNLGYAYKLSDATKTNLTSSSGAVRIHIMWLTS